MIGGNFTQNAKPNLREKTAAKVQDLRETKGKKYRPSEREEGQIGEDYDYG